jgi:hypothetical protein
MKRWMPICLFLLWALPAQGFVGHITGNAAERIPCHDLRTAVWLYVNGEATAGQAGQYLLDNYVTSWTPEDTTDNANLVTLLDNCGTFASSDCGADQTINALKKLQTVFNLESYCIAFQSPVTGPGISQNQFRNRLGMPTQ